MEPMALLASTAKLATEKAAAKEMTINLLRPLLIVLSPSVLAVGKTILAYWPILGNDKTGKRLSFDDKRQRIC